MTTRRARVTAVLFATAFTVACGRINEPAKAESPSLNVTDWTAKTELYMEYPPLVTGRRVAAGQGQQQRQAPSHRSPPLPVAVWPEAMARSARAVRCAATAR